jgi:hypothetical protein
VPIGSEGNNSTQALTGSALVPTVTSFAGFPAGPVRDRPHFIKLLLYGLPGAGKTYLAGQAANIPEMSPVLYLVPDAAELDTLRHVAPYVTAMEVHTWAQMEAVELEASRLAHTPSSGGLPFKTVVVDTGTEAQKLNMKDTMFELEKTGRPGGGEVNIDVPSVREWGSSISAMRRMIRTFRDLPANFIMCCHQTQERDNKGLTWTYPDLPGKLSNQAAGMFSNVFYLYVKQDTATEGKSKIITDEKHCLLTGLAEGYVAKSRTGTFPRVLVDATLEDIYRGIVSQPDDMPSQPAAQYE